MAADLQQKDDLRSAWRRLERVAGWEATRSAGVCEELLSLWSAPGRAYHNLQHLQECLAELDADEPAAAVDPPTVAQAIWFHDAIYDARRNDNEAASAELAIDRLRQLGESGHRIERVRQLILDTAHRADPATPAGELLVDIDLAILGKNPDRFDNYCTGIRLEYAHVPWPDYRSGRLKVLSGFLERQVIYRTPRLRRRYEEAARVNLARAIAELEAI